jgi:diacylglycerol kinase family enzyme
MLTNPAVPLRTRIDPQTCFYIILNAGSGCNDVTETCGIIEHTLTTAGRRFELTVVENPARLSDIAQQTLARAQQHDGIVVVGGGDGAINAVVQTMLHSDCPLGVLPQGTFNYFSRAHGIPSDTAAAVRALLDAHITAAQVGLVNNHAFLVNASLGLYPQLLEDREAYKQQYGRSRLVALVSGFATILHQHRQLRIVLETAGQARKIRTPTLFVGNNPLQLSQIGIPLEQALATGELAAITPKPVGTLSLLWLMLRGAFGQLGDADNVTSFAFRQLKVKPAHYYPRSRIKVATDGETFWLDTPLEFRVSPKPLYLLTPAQPQPIA